MTQENFTHAFERIGNLVAIFQESESFYLSPGYNEADARKDFIDKFWMALGWDVNHETQTDPYKQEVKVERGVAVSELRKRADYAFLAPNFRDVRFFVEAKKPHVGLDNPLYYFQTIRYGWNSHVPISVLTDFEEFRVLDCRYKPNIKTSPGHAVLKYHYTDYTDLEKFRTIYYLFSREAVLAGSIENFAQGLPKISRKRAAARGVAKDDHQSIDEAFLKELDEYREELARAFKRKNPELDGEALTEVTQRTLDRLVFMRFLEDKLIETEPLIEDLNRKGEAWENFITTSRRLDKIYNGIIFKEHPLLDKPSFHVDEKTFKKISSNLSYTSSPYDFNAIPIHILGSIYERFLGKVIVATAKQARVEEKPEVRKAGGVYYTPEYIVRYIVDNTVGKLIEGKTPEQIRQMRFADIACGSGSFLLGVYDTLLRYHTAYYNRTKKNQVEGRKAGCLETETGALRLSLLQKRTILLLNIYGVDIDPQAVEVAQLSLYLKLLEDETIASTHQQQMALRQALLPSLTKNIVCGNSLIDWDILEGKLFDSGEERKLNPMSFEATFPHVLSRGGFDAVIGNPPWGGDIDKQIDYFHRNYPATTREHTDSFKLFIEQGLKVTRPNGLASMIVPNTVLRQRRLKDVRVLMLENRINLLANLGEDVFRGVVAPSAIFVLEKDRPSESNRTEILSVAQFPPKEKGEALARVNAGRHLAQSSFKENADLEFMLSAKNYSVPIMTLGEFKYLECKDAGINYQRVKVGMQEKGKSDLAERLLYEGKREKLEDKMYWKGTDIDRYWTTPNTNRFCRPNYREFIKSNEVVHLNQAVFSEAPKILLRQTADHVIATMDYKGMWFGRSIIAITPTRDSPYQMEYFLGLLNSRYFLWLYSELVEETGRVFAQVKLSKIKQLPVRLIQFAALAERPMHDRMVQLVEQILEAKTQLASAQTERDKAFYESKCATLDRQIDNLVYELYDLTDGEIAIVESGIK